MKRLRMSIKLSLLIAAFAITSIYIAMNPQNISAVDGDGRIAFSKVVGGDGHQDIFTMNADGSDIINITNTPEFELKPVVSSDGSKVVFYGTRDDPPGFGVGEVYTMDIDGSNLTRLTDNDTYDIEPRWSPDGNKIVYIGGQASNYEIHIMDADGSNQTNISNNSVQDYHPSFSPDGTKILFYSYLDGDADIFTMNLDGSNLTNITNNSTDEYDPLFSPDGTKILFDTDRDGVFGNYELYTMNADGTNPVQLTFTDDEFANYYHSWSPDGSKIAFNRIDGNGEHEIYTMNADGTNQTNITNTNGVDEYYPFWYGPLSATPPPVVTLPDDNDGDGISNNTEDAGPNNGDANDDSIADSSQPNVTTLPSAVTNDYESVVSNCSLNNSVGTISEPNDFQDIVYDYPVGLINFTLTCLPGSMAEIKLYYFGSIPQNPVVRKYNSLTHTYQTVSGASLSPIIIGGQNAIILQYHITDGGALDQDSSVNGTIVDPIGPGTVTLQAPNTGFGSEIIRHSIQKIKKEHKR